MESLFLTSPLAADEVHRRLAALASEWRESAQPPVIRRLPALRLNVLLRGAAFRMSVFGYQTENPFGYRGRLTAVCSGVVRATATGCVIEGRLEPSRGDWIGLSILLGAGIGVAIFTHTWIIAVVGAALFGGEFWLRWTNAADQRTALRTVLADIAGAAPSTPPSLGP